MNICFCGYFSGGGTERITFQLANELAKRLDFMVYVLNTNRSHPIFPLHKGIIYVNLKKLNLLSRIVELKHFLLLNKISVVISIEALMGIYTIPATIGTDIKNIVWEHANYFQMQGSRWTHLIRKLWLRYADYYIVLTQRDLQNFKCHEKICCPIDFIYNPVKTLNQISTYNADSKIILSAGHLRPIKQFMLIPQIFAPIVRSNPDWQWHIYGDGSIDAVSELEAEIAKYGLQGKIILKGRSVDMDVAYNSAAMYVLTSRQEGLPTVLLEAQLHGLPCVSFDIETGPDEIIDDGVNGFLVEEGNVQQFAECAIKLMKDKKLLKEFAANAKKDLNRFETERIMAQWMELLNNL